MERGHRRSLLEQRQRKVLGRARARGTEADLPRLLLQRGQQALHGGGSLGAGNQDLRGLAHQGDGGEVPLRREAEPGVERRGNAQGIDVAHHERLPIGRGSGGLGSGNQPRRAWPVLDDDGNGPQLVEPVGDDPRQDVRAAACREADEDFDRARWRPGLCKARMGMQGGGCGGRGQELSALHGLSPWMMGWRRSYATEVQRPNRDTCASSKLKPSPGVWCSTTRPFSCASWRSSRRRKFSTWSSQKNST